MFRDGGGVEELTSTDKRDLAPGDVLEIETPGGGGFGAREAPTAGED